MNSLFKYVLPLLFAISLAACDSSAPNFEGTYGLPNPGGKPTPIVRVIKRDGKFFLSSAHKSGWTAEKEAQTVSADQYKKIFRTDMPSSVSGISSKDFAIFKCPDSYSIGKSTFTSGYFLAFILGISEVIKID